MLLINLNGKESIFEQIKTQIIRFIKLGILKPGDKLPSVRMLASDLGINPNTVARAYGELEKEGIIYTVNKKGVFVADEQKEAVFNKAAALNAITALKKDGVTKEELLEIIDELYQ